jgi:hypothetical protein
MAACVSSPMTATTSCQWLHGTQITETAAQAAGEGAKAGRKTVQFSDAEV